MKRPVDTELPGLAVALNPWAIREQLRRALPECESRYDLERVDVFDVRYKPGVHCYVLYRLKLRDRRTRKKHRHLMGAQVLRSRDPIPDLPEERADRYGACSGLPLRTPMVVLEEERIVGWSYPLDPGLPSLPEASDPATVKRALAALWRERDVRVRKVQVDLLGYTPQARASFLYTVQSEDRQSRVPEQRRLIAKTHTYKKPARLFADAWALWQAAEGRMGLAPPVGYLDSCRVTLQEKVDGEPLGGLEETRLFLKPARAVGRSVAVLHDLCLPLAKTRSWKHEAKVVRRWAGVLEGIRPRRAARLEKLRDRLIEDIEARIRVGSPVHGDFHHRNVLVHQDRVTIIDLDDLAIGDPMVDVGRFMASLRVPSMRITGDPDALHKVKESFLGQYLTKRDDDESRARLFEAACLLTAASSAFRIQRQGWEEQIDHLIGESEKLLNRSRREARPIHQVPKRRALAPLQHRVEWAEDPVYVRSALASHIEKTYGAVVTRARSAAGRATSRGYQFRYDLQGERAGRQWRKSLTGMILRHQGGKGVLRRLDALRDALEDDERAPLLPRPVGYLETLGLVVVERPVGVSVSNKIRGAEGEKVIRRVARALRALHAASPNLDKRRSVRKELAALRSRVAKLEEACPELLPRAESILAELANRADHLAEIQAPVLRSVRPGQVHAVGERIAFRDLTDPVLSHPFLDVASFLAGLRDHGIEEERGAEAERLAAAFRDAYGIESQQQDDLLTLEVAGVLSRACSRASSEEDERVPELLIVQAERHLSAALR